MHFNKSKYALALMAGTAGAVLMSGCVDDSYDLENIDTTMRFEVKDLTLPLNLGPVEFDDLVDLTDEECVEIINGEYVLVKTGDFTSDAINIKSIVTRPNVSSQPPVESVPILANVTIPVSHAALNFDYTYYGVDKYIVDLYSGTLDFDIEISISASQGGRGVPCVYHDLKLGVPAGLYGEYDGQKIGEGDEPYIFLNGDHVAADGTLSVVYHVTDFNCAAGHVEFDKTTRTFRYAGSVSLESGSVTPTTGDGSMGEIAVSFNLGELEVKTFNGEVYYELENLDVESIELNDLPDVLTDPETNIGLKNPQIYLSLSNPLSDYDVKATAGLDIRQMRNNVTTERAFLPSRLMVQGVAGQQQFCLSPSRPEAFYDQFPNSSWYEMRNLGNILKGKGLPQQLLIDFVSPRMEQTTVNNFALGQDLGEVRGTYTFYAPLQFTDDSRVIYTDTQGGWGLGSDEDLEITRLTIAAHVVSDLPVTVTLEAEPIDENGNPIFNTDGTPVTVTPATIAANTASDVKIELTGSIRNIDGMRYTVRLLAGQDATVLKPTMHLSLSNLKAIVSGYYEQVDDGDDDDYDYDYDYEY